jgi:hypothetical protein
MNQAAEVPQLFHVCANSQFLHEWPLQTLRFVVPHMQEGTAEGTALRNWTQRRPQSFIIHSSFTQKNIIPFLSALHSIVIIDSFAPLHP